MSSTGGARLISHALLAVCLLGVVAPPVLPAAQAVAAPPDVTLVDAGDVRALSSEKSTPFDLEANDFFGCSVATNGDLAVVGAEHGQKDDTPAGLDTGCAYTYVRLGSGWEYAGKLVAFDGAADDLFGAAVSIWGDTAIITAPQDDTGVGPDAGSAYIFIWTGATWSFQQKITAPLPAGPNTYFGRSVALCQDTVLVGAQDSGGTILGGAYVFTRTGSAWSFQRKLEDPGVEIGDRFGDDVALYRDTAVVGAWTDDDRGADAGAAYVFVRSGATWTKQAKVVAADGVSQDYFGAAVAVERDTLMVSARADEDMAPNAGAVYVYSRIGTAWQQSQKIYDVDADAGDGFGSDISFSGTTALIAAVGAYDDQGKVCVFGRNTGSWSQYGEIFDTGGAADDRYGCSVSACGGRFVVGVDGDDEADTNAGAAWLMVPELGHPSIARRLAGANRYLTAVKASQASNEYGAPTVVIATGENWPDALGGSTLAGAVRGPILLTKKTALPAEVRAEIVRLGARKAYILGSTASVSAGVENELVSLLGRTEVVRLGGANRYETDRLIVKESLKILGPLWDGLCIVVTGANYADAVAVSPFAAWKGVPIILADPRVVSGAVPSGTTEVGIAGSTAAVSAAHEAAFRAFPGVTRVTRVGGANRYETAALAAQRFALDGMRWHGMGLATGQNFPDALTAGPTLALWGSVLLLTRPTSLPGESQASIAANAAEIHGMTIFGDTNAVSAGVEAAAKTAAGIP